MDYEIAALQEMQTTFPNAQIFGCLFHLTWNMKKLTDKQLLGRYYTDADLALQARMIVSLSFVPIDSIDAALYVLTDAQNRLLPKLHPCIPYTG